MEIPHERWFTAIKQRHSRRQFDSGRSIPPEMWQRLQALSRSFKPFPGIRLELSTTAPETIFKGAVGSYGKVKGAPAYMAVIANTHQPSFQEAAGYTAEGLILEATSMGLSTCWVAGMFHAEAAAKQIPIRRGERILTVSPIGYAAADKTLEEKILSGIARSRNRIPTAQFVTGIDLAHCPVWISDALEAVRLAPSARNRQPWRLQFEPGAVVISTSGGISEFGISKRLDCGIAMLHFEVAARFHKITGRWQLLEPSRVARFTFAKV
ncbi:MAG TPA: nitroreductase family protein [Dehalococcoidales bacterium]|nr:nitroreductase family protein [Dehalococcoidales bacterium]